jgi:hypothetical protein
MKSSTHSVGDLLDRLNVVTRDEFVVGIKEFDARLFECSLCQKETLNPGETCEDLRE